MKNILHRLSPIAKNCLAAGSAWVVVWAGL